MDIFSDRARPFLFLGVGLAVLVILLAFQLQANIERLSEGVFNGVVITNYTQKIPSSLQALGVETFILTEYNRSEKRIAMETVFGFNTPQNASVYAAQFLSSVKKSKMEVLPCDGKNIQYVKKNTTNYGYWDDSANRRFIVYMGTESLPAVMGCV
jgi:hypothetical protein